MANKISNSTIEKIKRKSAYSLPDNPSERRWSATDIRNALFKPIVDGSDSLITEINRIVEELNGEKYTFPEGGIPYADLASAIQAMLDHGDASYIKPDGGIPSSDMAIVVQTALALAVTALQSESDPTVPAWAKAETKPTYTHTEVGAEASGSVSSHNASESSHSDIRALISALTTRLDALANSDDTTLDQMAEVVAYIKDNRSLIESITTGKVSVSDIVNDLTTNNASKVLSAAQGYALKGLVDGKYAKPSGGIPAADMALSVQNAVTRALGAVLKIKQGTNVLEPNALGLLEIEKDGGIYIGNSSPVDPSVKVWIDTSGDEGDIEMTANKTSTISALSTSSQYPTAAAVYSFVMEKLGVQCYDIFVTVQNGSESDYNAAVIAVGGTALLGFVFDGDDYICPNDVTVTGGSYTWTKVSDTLGELSLSNPSQDFTVSVEGVLNIPAGAIETSDGKMFLTAANEYFVTL